MNTVMKLKFLISIFCLLTVVGTSTFGQENTDREVVNPSTGSSTQAGSTSAGVGCVDCTKNAVQVDRDAKTTVKNLCYGVRDGAPCSATPKSNEESGPGQTK